MENFDKFVKIRFTSPETDFKTTLTFKVLALLRNISHESQYPMPSRQIMTRNYTKIDRVCVGSQDPYGIFKKSLSTFKQKLLN